MLLQTQYCLHLILHFIILRPEQKGHLLRSLASAIEMHQEILAFLEALNTGKSYTDILNFDIHHTIRITWYFSSICNVLDGRATTNEPDHYAFLVRRPVGVVGGLSLFLNCFSIFHASLVTVNISTIIFCSDNFS